MYYHIASFGIFLLLFLVILRIKRNKRTSFFLNTMAIILIIIPMSSYLGFIPNYYNDPLRNWQNNGPEFELLQNFEVTPTTDIYYLILDGYGRNDVLRDIYDFDNSYFLDNLQDRGFYIAEKSRSNYLQTTLSLASSMNIEYLDDLSIEGLNSWNRRPLRKLIADSLVRRILSNLGYSFISFDSGYDSTNIIDSDLYFHKYIKIHKFEEVYLSFTPLVLFDKADWNTIPLFTYQTHRSRIQYMNDQLLLIPSIPGPKFVFIHFLVPHPPFIFDRSGTPVYSNWSYSLNDANSYPGSKADYISGYTEQIQYVNKMVMNLVDEILANSDNQSIIVIQGDHGSRMLTDWSSVEQSCTWESSSILNAYLVEDQSNLYSSITPVNTFRLILNKLANTSYSLLEDRVYFSNFERPYKFTDITELSVKSCADQ
ncbi:sulfatase-like hydrolase/transferase [bacterium]|nr:sulfatase-like hydrolase/transferase [bacterium]